MSPLAVAAIGVAAASGFSVISRQFKAYGDGQGSYLSLLEGNGRLTALFMVVVSLGGAAMMTVVADGSLKMFCSIVGAFALFSAVVLWWGWSRKRKGR
jgi:hypothetical protein